jgi:hypothetical protein
MLSGGIHAGIAATRNCRHFWIAGSLFAQESAGLRTDKPAATACSFEFP